MCPQITQLDFTPKLAQNESLAPSLGFYEHQLRPIDLAKEQGVDIRG